MSYIIMFLCTLPFRQTLLIVYFELFTFKKVLKGNYCDSNQNYSRKFSINKNVYRFIPIILSL
jgi:hypothetical protein